MGEQDEMDEYKKLIKSAFGDSSDSEDDEQLNQQIELEDSNGGDEAQIQSIFGENPKWERFSKINGLSLCRDFLTPDQQSSLLSAIHKDVSVEGKILRPQAHIYVDFFLLDAEGWFTEASHNQAMRFGDLPAWASELSTSIREFVHFCDYDLASCDKDKEACLFPSELLWREPLFNQLIVNLYQPGEGISAHVDLMRFEDGIGLVSLESSCLMHFSCVETEACGNGKEAKGDSPLRKVPVYLTPGSLLLMWGEARYNWKHEINRKPGFQKWEGRDIDQKRRTSVTLRKLCRSE